MTGSTWAKDARARDRRAQRLAEMFRSKYEPDNARAMSTVIQTLLQMARNAGGDDSDFGHALTAFLVAVIPPHARPDPAYSPPGNQEGTRDG